MCNQNDLMLMLIILILKTYYMYFSLSCGLAWGFGFGVWALGSGVCGLEFALNYENLFVIVAVYEPKAERENRHESRIF